MDPPEGWVALDPHLDAGPPDMKRRNLWILVLEAKAVPFFQRGAGLDICVAPENLEYAVREISEFEAERHGPQHHQHPGYNNWVWVIALLSLLFVVDLLRWKGVEWGLSFLAAGPEEWLTRGSVEAVSMRSGEELWRVFTALTLHADGPHLFGNFVFGTLFLIPLCRRLGLGCGFLIAIAGGGLGNLFNIAFKPGDFMSIGFSTSVFAALGGLCALLLLEQVKIWRAHGQAGSGSLGARIRNLSRRIVLPLGAGLAFLAFLGGGEAPNTDYGAHILGFVAGLLLGLAQGAMLLRLLHGRFTFWPRESALARTVAGSLGQIAALALALGIPAWSWHLAFSR